MSVTERESVVNRPQPGIPAMFDFGVYSAHHRTAADQLPRVDSAVLRAFAVADLNDASWMCVSPDRNYFWVANHRDGSIATYRFIDRGSSEENFELVAITRAFTAQSLLQGGGQWIDLQLSDDGQLLYQLFEDSGAMAVYEVDGHKLALVEALGDERLM